MKRGIPLAVVLGIVFATPALAQKAADDHSAHHAGAQSQSAALADGEVRKVDKAAKKITIKHGPIPSLDMPAMTMVYRVKDAKLLTRVKAGDKINFTAEKIGDNYTLSTLEPAK
jgi:Cu(I)/Ag(I) efflux system protein CusF